ncbi:MAG TPA: TraC family protein [bacterium]|nr:TraC family protein [bacterium]
MRSDLAGSLTRELPYWTVRDGAVVLRDGSYRLGFEVALPGTEVWDAVQLARSNDHLCMMLNAAVPEGECLRVVVEVHGDYVDLLRAYENGCRSPHPVVRDLHRRRVAAWSRAHAGEQLTNYRIFFDLSYHPAGRARRWWTPIETAVYARHLEEMRFLRDAVIVHADRAGFRARPMTDDALVATIWRYFNPARKRASGPPPVPTGSQEVEFPRRLLATWPALGRASVRTVVARSDLYRRWDFLWMDGFAHAVVALDLLPDRPTSPNVLAPLFGLSGPRWIVMEAWNDRRSDQVKRLELKSRLSRQAVRAQDGGDSNARAVERQVASALDLMQVTGERVMRVGAAVVLQEPTPEAARESARRALDAFRQIPGVDARIESVALRRQFLQLAPFSGLPNERLLRMLSSNAADFVPSYAPWRGADRPVCPLLTRGASVVSLDPFDPRLPSWNAVVVGESGGGKTHFAIAWLSHLLALDPVIVIVDKGGAYRAFCDVYGGQHVRLDPSTDVAINPFDLLPGETDPDPAHLVLLRSLVALMIEGSEDGPGRQELAVLESAIRQTYERAAGSPVLLRDLVRTLRTFEQVGRHEAGPEEWAVARGIARRLERWTGQGMYARLLDRHSTVDLHAPIVCLDTEGLDAEYPELAPIAALLANHLVYRRIRSEAARPKYVVSDETWAALLTPVAAESLVGMFRRFRKFGAGVMAISQRLEDFEGEHARGILDNAPMKVLTRTANVDRVAPVLQLNDQYRALWRSLGQRRGAFNEVLIVLDLLEGREGGVVVVRDIPEDYVIATTTAEERLERDSLAREIGAWPAVQRLASRRRGSPADGRPSHGGVPETSSRPGGGPGFHACSPWG